MGIKKIHKLEQAVVMVLNIDGWELEHSKDNFKLYDASGKTPKGFDCVLEMKFRTKYYSEKMIDKAKYDALMKLPKDVVKLYFVNDPKGNFMFWLNNIDLPKPVKMFCPDTTMWSNKKLKKPVYLLKENQASIINLNLSY